jgi:homoserine kinase
VAAVFAANALLVEPLETKTLLPFALAGEAVTTGKAPIDNVAPQLLGGLCLAHPAAKTPIMLPVPDDVCCVLIHPAYRIETRQARSSLEKTIAMERSACYRNDLDLLAESLRDILVEPQRSSQIPGFDLVQNAAMKNSALGCSISGSGPAVFAWCRQADSGKVADAMQAAFRQAGLASTAYISSIGGPGVRLLKHSKKILKNNKV